MSVKKSASTGNLVGCITGNLFFGGSSSKPRKNSTSLSSGPTNDKYSRTTFISEDTIQSHLSQETLDSQLAELSRKSDTDLMADLFKTASELEGLAKRARKARRRKTTGARAQETRPGQTEITADDEKFSDDRSLGWAFSFTALLSPNRSKATTDSPTHSRNGGTPKCRKQRSRSLVVLSRPNMGSQPKWTDPEEQQTHRAANLKPFVLPHQYKPSYYHDSDDEDDDLVLDPDDNLSEISTQIHEEVLKMTIAIN